MKTFEEKWTAWLDGQLTGRELSEFEASLPDRAAAEAEKADAKKVGELLKRELGARSLTNEEVFSHQLRERIEQETGEGSRASAGRRRKNSSWWTIPRLLWAGTVSLALFLVCMVLVMQNEKPAEESQYLTQILNARIDPDRGISEKVFWLQPISGDRPIAKDAQNRPGRLARDQQVFRPAC